MAERDVMEVDVLIVGAGPAGLSAGIRLRQLALDAGREVSVCVLEKGASVGAHILSGAVLEPRALDELLPDWQALGAPVTRKVTRDRFYLLSQKRAWRLPTPGPMKNNGNYIISLGELCQWLAAQAEQLGVQVYPGIAAAAMHFDEQGRVNGVLTGDLGVDKNGERTPEYQPGMLLRAKQTLLAEGCRGSLTEKIIQQFDLRAGRAPQSYGIGIKELWRVDNPLHQPGLVMHTIGWPLDQKTYGGSFLYHLDNQQLAYGFVVGLDYQNPFLNPFQEMQRFKLHPAIKPYFENGERISYGARALNEGGWQSMPQLDFPGGLIIGCAAGFLNVPKIKGTHTAMKSGMLAAAHLFETAFQNEETPSEKPKPTQKKSCGPYETRLKNSWIAEELYRVRNIRPAFHWGLWPGLIYSAVDHYLLRGKAPWTFSYRPDNTTLTPANQAPKIDYPKPDGQFTFDRLSSVYLTNTYHAENQPCHLTLKDKKIPIKTNLKRFDAPETRYCPAAVYEIVYNNNKEPELRINAQNCIHCKTCDIKDPEQNIVWEVPEGGGGPNYQKM